MDTATRNAQDARSRLEPVARAGYVVNGALHVLIGYLALRVAFGGGGRSADQTGALGQVASNPAGQALLWIGTVALAALALWQLVTAAIAGRTAQHKLKEVSSAGAKAVVFAVLALTAGRFANGGSSSSERSSNDVTQTLMRHTAGTTAVFVIGLVVVGVGVYHVVKGVTDRFREELGTVPGHRAQQASTWAGRTGYAAKGLALGIVGVLFCTAAVRSDPDEAGGLDSALHTLTRAPYGAVLLALVGLGFAAYGVYCAVRARYGEL